MDQANRAQFCIIRALKFNIQRRIVSKLPHHSDIESKFGLLLDIDRPKTGKICIAINEMSKRPQIDRVVKRGPYDKLILIDIQIPSQSAAAYVSVFICVERRKLKQGTPADIILLDERDSGSKAPHELVTEFFYFTHTKAPENLKSIG